MADEQNNSQQSELEKFRAQAEEYLNGWKRAKADLVNYQKQVERERSEWFMYANAGCVKAMLPVLDSLEAAAFPVIPAPDAARGQAPAEIHGSPIKSGMTLDVDGITKIRDQMMDVLHQGGVEAIPIAKEPVNPELHEVVGVEKVEAVASGLMVREVQRGYIMHGKTLRPAKVIVAE